MVGVVCRLPTVGGRAVLVCFSTVATESIVVGVVLLVTMRVRGITNPVGLGLMCVVLQILIIEVEPVCIWHHGSRHPTLCKLIEAGCKSRYAEMLGKEAGFTNVRPGFFQFVLFDCG